MIWYNMRARHAVQGRREEMLLLREMLTIWSSSDIWNLDVEIWEAWRLKGKMWFLKERMMYGMRIEREREREAHMWQLINVVWRRRRRRKYKNRRGRGCVASLPTWLSQLPSFSATITIPPNKPFFQFPLIYYYYHSYLLLFLLCSF